MVKNIGDSSWELKIKAKDVDILSFSDSKSETLGTKILSIIDQILDKVGKWQMIFVDPKELEIYLDKAKSRKWRKNHANSSISLEQAYDAWIKIGWIVRKDFDNTNLQERSVKGCNFSIKDRKGEPSIVASIYTVWWSEKILLLRSIYEHPLLAYKFLAFLRWEYEGIHKENKKKH